MSSHLLVYDLVSIRLGLFAFLTLVIGLNTSRHDGLNGPSKAQRWVLASRGLTLGVTEGGQEESRLDGIRNRFE
jgi:hypothetical protein